MIFINQLREKIGVMFGSPETTSGGRALKFYASIRLDVRKLEQIKIGQDVVGSRTRVKVVKNKVAPPFRQAEFDITYGRGISKMGSILDVALERNIVGKSGSWYTYGESRIGQGRENAKAFLEEHTRSRRRDRAEDPRGAACGGLDQRSRHSPVGAASRRRATTPTDAPARVAALAHAGAAPPDRSAALEAARSAGLRRRRDPRAPSRRASATAIVDDRLYARSTSRARARRSATRGSSPNSSSAASTAMRRATSSPSAPLDERARIEAAYDEDLARSNRSLSYPSVARKLERLGFPASA